MFGRSKKLFNEQMKEKLAEFNHYLKERDNKRPDKQLLRQYLSSIGQFVQMNGMSTERLQVFSNGKGIVGVDGSYMVYGNTFPHVIFLGQALAKCSNDQETEGVKSTYLDTGLTFLEAGNEDPAETFLPIQRNRVTQMEVEVAHEALLLHKPFITMFDGGFWRLSKEAEEQWESFRRTTLEQETLCVGVIEDAGSYDMYSKLNQIHQLDMPFFPDSDILFGLLDIGEVFILNDLYRDKFKRAFARFSNDPLPIACDFLPEQEGFILDILDLVYLLTPKEGRGIPFWIDIVDSEVKLTDDTIKMLIDSYIDNVYKERYFTGKRNRR